ncbi:MAG: flagellar basal body rod C-terminal domain-containing protein [Humidesulfovibrio sp.]|jgi:flagellar basal body rod protein FlgG|uniref:flagellar basal body rod C-terminal domain-containing protein n=1 Tax=Humidesulfovibrio sp. TaxID=2910988 RepID=UPI0027373E93|nr:flagellar basal body rod C-terminal domain-containing protein [Humidesulfovibrio sp.]MDP2846734.1 flagellar basal body rod C-terminal domain-containing protein [Humidesulfovibrio sp.]
MSLSTASNLQALSALGVSMQATASNIANSLTDGYRPVRAEFADGPGGQGVQVAAVTTAEGASPQQTQQGAVQSMDPAERRMAPLGMGSGVDIVREMMSLMQIERAYAANATVISSVEQTTGHVMDLIA